MQKQKKGLLDQQELEIIWMCLREHRTTPDDESGAERVSCLGRELKQALRVCPGWQVPRESLTSVADLCMP